MNLETYIRDIPDFPKEGIVFKDITPLLASPEALKASVAGLAKCLKGLGATKVLGAEARGFIFGAAVACVLDIGFVPIRKPGKLPAKEVTVTYDLEYGTDTLCMHEDAIKRGEKVVIVDDLLATGGTVAAVLKLVEGAGAEVVGMGFVVELDFLHGRARLGDHRIESLVRYG